MQSKWTRIVSGIAVAAITTYVAVPVAHAAQMQLRVSGTTNGSPFGFPDTFVTQTTIFDSEAVPATDVVGNVTFSTYDMVSYELDFGGTLLTPVSDWDGQASTPLIHIEDAAPGGPFGNPDRIMNGAALNEDFAGFAMKGFLLVAFDYSQVAIDNTALPTSVAYFDQFANPLSVQIDFQDSSGARYAINLNDQVVELSAVPEPGTLMLLAIGAVSLVRRRG